jgi:hypothetical protein
MMIEDADEFIRLRRSENSSDYLRAANDNAPLEVWRDIIARHAEMRPWVAHNKTIPLEILAILANDPSSDVRHMVAMKNKLSPELMLLLPVTGMRPSDDELPITRTRPSKLCANLLRTMIWISLPLPKSVSLISVLSVRVSSISTPSLGRERYNNLQ